MGAPIEAGRFTAQTELTRNLVVEAGAGTGKTTLLITRLCLAILVQKVPVERLVAMTFTEKAAAEMKTRLVSALHEIIAALQVPHFTPKEESLNMGEAVLSLARTYFQKVPRFAFTDKELLARAEAALTYIERANIGTIHSFCADILKQFPLEAGLPPNAEIDTGPKLAYMFENHWHHFLETEMGDNAPHASQWKMVLEAVTLSELKDFAQELCDGKVEKYDYWAYAEKMAQLCQQKIIRCKEIVASKKRRITIMNKLDMAADSLKRSILYLTRQPFERKTLSEGDVLTASVPSKPHTGWTMEEESEACTLVRFAKDLLPERQHVFTTAYELVQPLVERVRTEFIRNGNLTFNDLIVKTRDLLQRNLSVRRLLKERFDVLFVDEFQDTDPLQGEIFLFLAEKKNTFAPHWQQVDLEEGKLFVVGDPKQSIYRFRGADIEAYTSFTDLIIANGGQLCTLENNYRSVPAIVDFANSACAPVMQRQAAYYADGSAENKSFYQADYKPIEPTRAQPKSSASVQWLFVEESGAASAEEYRQNQAAAIAQWIHENVGHLKLSDGRTLAYKDVTILFRSLPAAHIYTRIFRHAGIPFHVEADRDYFRKQEVNDLLNVLRLLVNPYNAVALTGVLRSPWQGFTDQEIYRAAQEGALDLFKTPSNARLSACYERLRLLVQTAAQQSVPAFLEQLFYSLFFAPACAAAYEGEKTLDILNHLAQLAQDYTDKMPVSIAQFLTYLEEMLADVPEQLTPSLPSGEQDVVTVMTVHKAKGLAFPVVIFADLSKVFSRGDGNSHLFGWRENIHGLRVGDIKDVSMPFLEEEQDKHEACEEMRILYVALTRAREKLLLVGNEIKLKEVFALKTLSDALVEARLFPSKNLILQQKDEQEAWEKLAALAQQAGNPAPEKQRSLADEILCYWTEKEQGFKKGDLFIPVVFQSYATPESVLRRVYAYHRSSGSTYLDEASAAAWRKADQARREDYKKLLAGEKAAPSRRTEEGSPSYQTQGSAVAVGTLCHHALQWMFSHHPKNPSAQLSAALDYAVQAASLPEHKAEAQHVLDGFVKSALFARLYSYRLLACEMPFSYIEQGQTVEGFMDLVLRKPEGNIWIVDYKTDLVTPGHEKEQAEKYRAQLSVYRAVGERVFAPASVQSSVAFVRSGEAVDL